MAKDKRSNYKSIEALLTEEDKFVTNLFSILAIPESAQKLDSDEESDSVHTPIEEAVPTNKTQRATTLTELQKRLDNIKKTKKKLSYKDKLLKKGIKNRMKRKSKQDQKNAEQKQKRAAKLLNGHIKTEDQQNGETTPSESKQSEPIFNKEDKIVYSKIDFANLGQQTQKKRKRDPKQLLEDIQREKEKIKKLEEEGDTEKAIQVKEKSAWKNAIAKAQGEKVKDDEALLKKTVQRKEQKVRSSKKKWKARIDNVEKSKQERQNKRQENIDKRKKDKKNTKLKKAAKRGKIIPGF